MKSDSIEWKKKQQNLHVEVAAVLFRLPRVKSFCREVFPCQNIKCAHSGRGQKSFISDTSFLPEFIIALKSLRHWICSLMFWAKVRIRSHQCVGQHVGGHTTDTPMTHYQRNGLHTNNTLAEMFCVVIIHAKFKREQHCLQKRNKSGSNSY